MRTVCVRAGLTLLALAVSAGAQSGGGPVLNGLWVYSVSSLPNAVSDEPTRDTLIQNSSASGVKWLYVSVYQSTRNGEGRYMYEDGDIADLITKAHMQGMQVYGAYGDTDWPTLGCDASAFPMKRMAEVIAYNAANPTAPFDGVMLDVEPGSSPDFVALLESVPVLSATGAGEWNGHRRGHQRVLEHRGDVRANHRGWRISRLSI